MPSIGLGPSAQSDGDCLPPGTRFLVTTGDRFPVCGTQGVVPTHGGLPEPDADTQDAQWDWNLRDARERHGRKPV